MFALTLTAIMNCSVIGFSSEAASLRSTIIVAHKVSRERIRRDASYWKTWHTIFHAIMIPTHFVSVVWTLCVEEFKTFTLATMQTLVPHAVKLTCIPFMFRYWHKIMVETLVDVSAKATHQVRKNLGQPRTVALPARLMVLSEVMLSAWFVRSLETMGIIYKWIIDEIRSDANEAIHRARDDWIRRQQQLNRRAERILLCMMVIQALAFRFANAEVKRFRFHRNNALPECLTQAQGKTHTTHPIEMQDTAGSQHHLCRPICRASCFVSEAAFDNDVTALTNLKGATDEEPFAFGHKQTEFGADNCATHHVCGERQLFSDISEPKSTIGIRGISGTSSAAGVGTVKFKLKDDDGIQHNVILKDVIFLPDAAKNLISITKWSKDNMDDCGITSRGNHSTFKWCHDKHVKTIVHPPSCPIPLMPVNEDDDPFILFVNKHSNSFIDREPDQQIDRLDTLSTNDLSDKQFEEEYNGKNVRVDELPMEGETVRATIHGQLVVSTVTKVLSLSNGDKRLQIRPLNQSKLFVLHPKDVSLPKPDPSSIPHSTKHVDSVSLAHSLTEDEMKQLWAPSSDDTVPPEARITLYWHHRLRCAPLITLKRLAKRGILPKSILKVDKMPLCASCAFATAHRRAWRTKGGGKRHIRKEKDNTPGSATSCDHIISHQPGLIPQSSGRLTHDRFWGSVLYVDHYSDFMFNHMITGPTSKQTLDSKHAYERVARSHGVTIKSYRADNSRFDDNNFRGDCVKANQQLTLCGVGAHHQNGVAESKVKQVCEGARTILLHAKRRWPTVISTVLWPYAMQAIIHRHNRLSLDEEGNSPLEKFTGTRDDCIATEYHTWGCPTFILDAANQSGSIGTPKWDPKAHAGIYLGHSPCHAGSVALVLNLKTGLVSPQFHIVFDDNFMTVPYLSSIDPPPFWTKLVKDSTERYTDEENQLAFKWLHPDSSDHHVDDQHPTSTPITTKSTQPLLPGEHIQNKLEPKPNASAPTRQPSTTFTSSTLSESAGERTNDNTTFVNVDQIGLRRSPRIRQLPPRKVKYGLLSTILLAAFDMKSAVTEVVTHCYQARVVAYDDFLERNFDGSANNLNPLAHVYMSIQANNETYTLKEMLAQPDKDKFVDAMYDEVDSMFREGIWEAVPKTMMLEHYRRKRETGLQIRRHQIMMIWSFRRKRKPDGTLIKHKARLCCHGGQQELGINYWDTYAPVVSWSSIRILLILANVHNLHSKSVDFVQAYPQARIKSDIFLHPPPGVELNQDKQQTVLKLRRNLYGLKDAGRTWHEHLVDGLTAMGFTATESDPCIFTRGPDIMILYVDDCVILARSKQRTSEIYSQLLNQGYKLTDEGTIAEYLGMSIKHNNHAFTISQPHLIDRIIASVPGMQDARSAKTPAATGTVLTKDELGEERKEEWNYRSLVGMLNYLVNCSQPELAYSVHQCARFCSNPKRSHEQAIKRILRYLQFLRRSNTQGINFKPDRSRSIDTFVDASFAGEWNAEWSEEPSSVMSRTGYIINYANCPVIWSSKLQSEIALSTTEAEYIALSQSLRDVLPLVGLLRELQRSIPFDPATPVVHCKIHEDNQGCIDLVKAPRMRPRTKHIALKYHHFRKHVKDGTISITYLETARQVADIFTKPLGDSQFAVLRQLLMGWPKYNENPSKENP